MVKKTKSTAKSVPESTLDTQADGQLAAAVKDSAQQIWLAGLGAFAKAQEEGSKVFEALVKEGKGIQKRTRATAGEQIGRVTGLMSSRVGKVAGDLSKQATESWDRLEQVFEERVARAMNRLGVPTNADVKALQARIDALDASVQALSSKPARAPRAARAAKAAAPAPAPAPAARKAAAPRRTAAKKPAPAATAQ
jgi:poly(hydroxyalkanoate) granule-associated protein